MGVNDTGDAALSSAHFDGDSFSKCLGGDVSLAATISYILDAGAAQSDLANGKIVDYSRVRTVLQERLDSFMDPAEEDAEYPEDSGRLGPRDVIMRSCGSGGLVCERRLESTSNFGSAIANVGVLKGRWMYEVSLWTGGIQQLGWATLRCPFTNEEGVGDTRDSYAYDGKRIKKWNKRAVQYGKAWTAGDVIGACIDLDTQEVSFYLNGESLGVAFKEVRLFEPHLAYFPAVSLSLGESCSVNVGRTPFRYPVDGFQPLQKAPPPSITLQCSYLLQCLERLTQVEAQSRDEDCVEEKAAASGVDDTLASSAAATSAAATPRIRPADQTLLASCIAHHLGEHMTDEYTVESALLPFLLHLHGRSEFHAVEKLQRVLALFRVVLEEHELEAAMQTVLGCLGSLAATVSLQSQQLPYSGSYPYIALAAVLVECPHVARRWVLSPSFHEHLEQLLTVKQPSQRDLEALLPQVWWEGCPSSLAQNEVAMMYKVSMLRAAMNKIEERHLMLLRALSKVPGVGISGYNRSTKAPPQSAFTVFCHNLVRKNVGVTRQIQPHGLSDNSVLVSVFYAIMWMLGPSMQVTSVAEANPSQPMDSTDRTDAVTSGECNAAGIIGSVARTAETAMDTSGSAQLTLLRPKSGEMAVTAEAIPPSASSAVGADRCSTGDSAEECSRALEAQHVAESEQRSAWNNTLQHFPAAELFVPDRSYSPDPYLGFNRVGGVLGEVLKLRLEPWEHEAVDLSQSVATPQQDACDCCKATNPFALLPHQMLDLAMMLYVVGLQVTYKWTSHHSQSLNQSLSALSDLTNRLKTAEEQNGSAKAIASMQKELREKVSSTAHQVRLAAWLHKARVPLWVLLHASESCDRRPSKHPAAATSCIVAAFAHDLCTHDKVRESRAGIQVTMTIDTTNPQEVYPDMLAFHWSLKKAEYASCFTMFMLLMLQLRSSEPEGEPCLLQTDFESCHDRNLMEMSYSHVELMLQVYVHGGWKRQACISLVTYLSNLLSALSDRSNLWSYVAESYVECTLATLHALQRSSPSPNELLPAAIVDGVVHMLVKLLNDKRVVSPYMREIMLSSVKMLFSQQGYLRMLEHNEIAVKRLIPALLQAYNQELWMPLSTILVRLLDSSGSSNRQDTGQGSEVLRKRLACVCFQRTPEATNFVNQLFSSLNWAITELTTTMRDLDNMQLGMQRRQVVLFEFAVNSCRLLEFLFVHAPLLFMTGPPIYATRLCEMLSFVISHIDGKEGSQGLRRLTAILPSDAAKLHPLHLLAPVLSMLMFAWQLEYADGFESAVAEQRAIQNAFGCGESWAEVPDKITHSIIKMIGSLKEACSTERLEALAECDWSKAFGEHWRHSIPRSHRWCYDEFLAQVRQFRERGGEVQEPVPDDFLDPIMMCVMEDPVILPDSKVTVDRSTIIRHLQGSETDPFSRAPLTVAQVTPNDELREKLRAWRLARQREPVPKRSRDLDASRADDATL